MGVGREGFAGLAVRVPHQQHEEPERLIGIGGRSIDEFVWDHGERAPLVE